MEDILAQASKVAEHAEVFAVSSEVTEVHFEANRLKHLHTKQSTTIALRIIRRGRIGYATTTRVDDAAGLVSQAVETAEFGAAASFQLPARSFYPDVAVFDAAVESIPTGTMIGLGEEMINAVRAHTPGIICEAGISKGTISVRLINSGGGEVNYRKSLFSLGIEGSLISGTDMLFVGDSQSSCHPITEAGAVTEVVLEQLELAKNQAAVPSRPLPVIFTPTGVASALVMPLMAAFNGKTVLEGASPVGNKIGQPVFDAKLSLYDDPTLGYRPASRPADDEGVPSQRTPLVEGGTVKQFLYDLQTAARARTRSTASASRSSSGLPSPAPSAFVIATGSTSFEEMVADIREGLVVEQLMGAEQGNILGGDFSGNVLLGYKIESGKIVGRVKDTMVSGNVYQVLGDMAAIGSKPRWVGGFLQTPHLYCPRLSVTSKG